MAELADAIVQSGRETLESAIRMVNSHPRWRARVVYGDTGARRAAILPDHAGVAAAPARPCCTFAIMVVTLRPPPSPCPYRLAVCAAARAQPRRSARHRRGDCGCGDRCQPPARDAQDGEGPARRGRRLGEREACPPRCLIRDPSCLGSAFPTSQASFDQSGPTVAAATVARTGASAGVPTVRATGQETLRRLRVGEPRAGGPRL